MKYEVQFEKVVLSLYLSIYNYSNIGSYRPLLMIKQKTKNRSVRDNYAPSPSSFDILRN